MWIPEPVDLPPPKEPNYKDTLDESDMEELRI